METTYTDIGNNILYMSQEKVWLGGQRKNTRSKIKRVSFVFLSDAARDTLWSSSTRHNASTLKDYFRLLCTGTELNHDVFGRYQSVCWILRSFAADVSRRYGVFVYDVQ